MTYPLPSYAASIWTEGDTIWLGLPSLSGERGHSVPVPNSPEGIAQVLRILAAREKEPRGKIGTDASPTRGQIEAAMARREQFRREREAKAESKPKFSSRDLADADKILQELGMI